MTFGLGLALAAPIHQGPDKRPQDIFTVLTLVLAVRWRETITASPHPSPRSPAEE